VWRAKYDLVNTENEQLRVMLRLLLGESGGDASQHGLPRGSSIQPRSMTVDALLSQPVVNMDVRGGTITDVGRDVHSHVHNHWVTIYLRFVRFIIVICKCDADRVERSAVTETL
jgi:hypothetical protein